MKPMREHEQKTNKLNLLHNDRRQLAVKIESDRQLQWRTTMEMAAQFEPHSGVKR